MIDVLVTCLAHSESLCHYPQIQGHYLAKHLARLGLNAEFRQLPLPASYRCRVLISSEYPAEMEWFERYLLEPLSCIQADRLFCLFAYTLGGRDHYTRETLEWFKERGGVLCCGLEEPPGPHEHWVGVGVDTEVVAGPAELRNTVVFDPVGDLPDVDGLDLVELKRVRRRLPGIRLLGCGPAEHPPNMAFEAWLPYGQSHPAYVEAALGSAFAVVPMKHESLGLTLAEAQVAGSCVVSRPYAVKDWMVVPEAGVPYLPSEPNSLADALVAATYRDPREISAQAQRRFDFEAMARRVQAAIGL